MVRRWMLVAVMCVLGLTITPTEAVPPPLKLTITPEHAHIPPGTDLSIMCMADVPLTHCQFKVRNYDIYDLSAGFDTPFANEYSYYGEGLESGECGMTLSGTSLEFVINIAACRVRSNDSDWVLREMAIVTKTILGMEVTFSPGRTVVVLPEQPINVLVDAHKPLTRCTYVLTNDFSGVNENRRFNFNQDNAADSKNPTNTGIDYYGAGVSKGQCGLQMLNATEELNDGFWMDVYDGSKDQEETLFFRIIVARAPSVPKLIHNEAVNADGTLSLDAWCTVRSRPAGNITWYLGGEPIEEKFSEFIITDAWVWPSNIQRVTQKLTIVLGPEHNGMDLWCSVEHFALKAPLESERIKIKIESSPTRESTTTELDQNTAQSPLKLTITPEHAHVTPGNDISIMCKADVPLTHCQFRVHNFPVFDFSAGVLPQYFDEFAYYGKGLEYGECGVTLSGNTQELVFVVGCRARSSTSDWAFREMTLVNKRKSGINVTFTPASTLVILPQLPINVLVDAHKPLTQCSFVLNNDFGHSIETRRFNFDQDNVPAAGNPKGTGIEYYGTGVSKGQCGFQVTRAREELNDGAFIDVFDSENHEETRFFRIIVARPPKTPTLVYNTTVNPDGTLNLDASCSARSRPAGNITWYLGGEPVAKKFTQFIPAKEWVWPSNFHTVRQKLSLKLGRDDNDKDLWCAVEHLALRTPIESKRIKIEVKTPPSAPILDVKTPYLSEGANLEASCTVNNWQPDAKVTWYLGGVVLRQDNKNDDPSETILTQRLSHLLQRHEDGLELRCEVEHSSTLPQPLKATYKVIFTYCSPLISRSVRISCSVAGEQVNCALPQQVGTIAQLVCKPGYTVAASIFYRRVTCTRAVKWDRAVFTCTPACGRRNTNSGTTLVSRGVDSKIGEFPWHVGIYEQVSATSNTDQICGGTIISPNIVVSAAHCFWQGQKKKDTRKIRVAAGKHIRDWDDTNLNVQKRNVSEIILPDRYSGRQNQFASDIALLKLSIELELTGTVNLICIDWENEFEGAQLREGNMGTVPGWGYTENGTQSHMLKYVNLPYVSADVCATALTNETKPVFTHDKFCAGYVGRSTSVCKGDSGGGLVFRHPGTNKYYLRGIVSIAFTPPSHDAICYSQLYTGFTKFSMFLNWVQENV